MCASAEPVDPTMATKMATPRARPSWRTMLITPDPVANDEAGSADVPSPISVGSASPTPMPDEIMQRTANPRSGCDPVSIAHATTSAVNTTSPAAADVAEPNRVINLPASNNDVTGTMKGPGAMARPIFMADQCQTPCSHDASESRKPPNPIENGVITKVARVKSGMRNKCRIDERIVRSQAVRDKQRQELSIAVAKLSVTAGAFHPQSFSFTIPNVSAAMPMVMSAATQKFGAGT